MRRTPIALLLACALIASAELGPSAPADAQSGVRAEHARIVAFWTPERMRSAEPRDFVRRADGGVKPAKRMGARSGQGVRPGHKRAISGRPWRKGGPIVERTGIVLFTLDGDAFRCSGFVVRDGTPGRAIVATAGHCAYDWLLGYATNWLFLPSFERDPRFDCQERRRGCWTASALVLDADYVSAGEFSAQAAGHDWAFAVIEHRIDGRYLDETVGSLPITFDARRQQRRHVFGYPTEGRYAPGAVLIHCAGRTFPDTLTEGHTIGMRCDMNAGSSGAPWLRRFRRSIWRGSVGALTSYSYVGLDGYQFGPRFDDETEETFNAAKTATANLAR